MCIYIVLQRGTWKFYLSAQLCIPERFVSPPLSYISGWDVTKYQIGSNIRLVRKQFGSISDKKYIAQFSIAVCAHLSAVVLLLGLVTDTWSHI